MQLRALAVLVLIAACVPAGSVVMGSRGEASVDADPAMTLWAAAEVFERVGIPVASMDEGREVRSGTFTVRQTWGGDLVHRRLQCPAVGDLDPSTLYDASFAVSVVAHARDAGADGARIMVTGDAVRQGEEPQRMDRIQCSLREPFRAWLTEEVRRRALNLPTAPRTY